MSDGKLPPNLSPDAKRALLAELIKRKAARAVSESPASYGQRALWFIYQLDPSNSVYNVSVSVRLRGRVDADVMRRAIGVLIRRHASLRTTFALQGSEPVQRVRGVIDTPFVVLDARGCDEDALRERVLSQHRIPFDLENGPTCRAALFTVRDDEHILLIGAHHTVVDARSLALLLEEALTAYVATMAGKEASLPPVAHDYAAFARWQAQMLRERGGELEAFWRDVLRPPLPTLELASDRPRPAAQSFRGEAIRFTCPQTLAASLRDVARAEGVTLFGLLVAAYFVLLQRYSGQDDVIVGSPAIGRTRAEFERVVGYFVNPVALRANLAGDPTFKELLAQVRGTVQGALAHQDYPFALLVERLQPERASNRPPVFQVMFNMIRLDGVAGRRTVGPIEVEPYWFPQEEGQFDLALDIGENGSEILGMLRYSTDLFDSATAERLLRFYRTLLTRIVQSTGTRLSALSAAVDEEVAQFDGWNATARAYASDEGVEALFAAQAQRVPDAVAVTSDAGQLSYRALDEAANRLAWRLQAAGVGPDTLVGVCMQRTPDLLVALLGILKAGGAYVPLDPAFPAQRLALMAADARLRLILTDAASRALVPAVGAELLDVAGAGAGQPVTPPPTAARGEHLAYVLYTSGSTGRPKGVEVPRRAFTNFIRAMQQQPGLTERDVVLAITTLSFDIAGLELFLPLSVGARIVLATREQASDGTALGRLIARSGVTVMQATPATWRMLLTAGWTGHPALRLLCGGEPLPADLAAELRRHGGALWNMYGPTETTVWSTLADVTAPDTPITIGRPIANTRLYILDAQRQRVPIGVWGELWIAGDGVARGYLGRPDLTAERFVDDPFHPGGGRMYRTGDRARFRPDGTVECQGRLDFQVKVRGFRIELEEIETALREQPGVTEAVVVVDGTGDRARLLAGVQLAPGAALDERARRDRLRDRLPDYMIPAALLAVEDWPLTANQKIDRPRVQARLAAALSERGPDAAAVPPATPTEQALAALWADLLRVGSVNATDNFFTLGGHSLLATQLVARIRDHFAIELPLRRVFETETLRAAAADIDDRLCQRDGGSRRPALVAVSRSEPLRASHTQERMWFLHQLFPESTAYHIPIVLRLEGTLDVAALQRSWSTLVERHEGLRTRFSVDGDQVVQHFDAPPPMTMHTVTEADAAARDAEVRRLCETLARTPFDLARGPLTRAVLIALPDSHVLALISHHIVLDQWSLGVVLRELIALYREAAEGVPAALPVLPVQYADYAAWERQVLTGPEAQEGLSYWAQQLEGVPVLELPTDHVRPPTPSMRGAVLTLPLDPAVCGRVRTLAAAEGVTLATCLTATFAALLSRYTGQHDLPIGIAVANRAHTHLTNVVGAFINTLVLRVKLDPGASFRDLVKRVHAVSLDAYTYQHIPFDHLVATLRAARDLSRSPLVQVMFNVLNTPTHGIEWPGLRWSPVTIDRGGAQLDLSVHVEAEVTHTIAIEYNTDVFSAETIERLVRQYLQLLEAFVNAPEQVVAAAPMLTPTEAAQFDGWNATARAYASDEGVEALFAAQAQRVPDAVAVTSDAGQLSYRALDEAANRLAWRLQAAGVGPDTLVGVCMQRTPDLLVALLGILKAGGAYVPLDPAFPAQRLALMAADARLRLILTDAASRALVPAVGAELLDVAGAGAGQPVTPPPTAARGEHLAYVLYTSGSTGRPKGVEVPRRAFTNFIRAMQQQPGLTERDVVLAITTLSFDIAGLELFLPLSVGARIVLATREQASDGTALGRLIARSGVTVMQATPATWRMLLTAGWTGHPALRLLCGGEPLPADLAAELRRHGGALWNMYGPTETTVWSTLADVTAPDTPITIGRPIANTRLYILDAQRQRVPIGVWGELWIAGDGVARGYLGRPDLTAERFVDDPFHPGGGRMYRTGDRARFRPDGTVECQGRLDFQVKVRGFRIELEEIETALREQPGVTEAVVVVDGTGDRARLLAGVQLAPGAALDERARRDRLRDRLPDYMIPAALLAVEDWPLTANQKIDRPRVQARLAAALSERGPDAAAVPPATPTEQALAALWADLLRVGSVNATDNFFTLGGHSLLATQLVARIRDHFAIELPLRDIFETETLTALAARVDALVMIMQLAESPVASGDAPREEFQL